MPSRSPSRAREELAALVALDACEEYEQAEHLAHASRCAACSRLADELAGVTAALATAAATAPPARVRGDVLAAVARTSQVPAPTSAIRAAGRHPRRKRLSLTAALALAASVVIVAGITPLRSDRPSHDVDAILGSADGVVSELAGAEDSATVTVVWSPGADRVAVVADGLSDPGPERAYALWQLAGGRASPAGVFVPVGGRVEAVLEVEDRHTEGWGVTVEPATGSTQPTGPILFSGDT